MLGNFEKFLEKEHTPREIWQSVRGLAYYLRKHGLEDVLDRHDERVLGERFRAFLDKINEPHPDGRTIVFIVDRPYFLILREAACLRREGHRAFLFAQDPLPENLIATFDDVFDGVLDARGNCPLMRKMLPRIEVEVFHVQCMMWNYTLGRMVIEHKGKAAVVCEFYDVTSIFAERGVLLTNWSVPMVDHDLSMERYILNHADAVITRFPSSVTEDWYSRNGAKLRDMEFQAYPCAEFISYSDRKISDEDGVIRLVFGGNLVPVDKNHPPSLFPETTMHQAFGDILEQGIAIDLLHVPHAPLPEDYPSYTDYHELARRFERFRIMEGVPPDSFSERIADYDFGILLFHFDPDIVRLGQGQVKGVIATKIFSYLEAGLPVLVNAEYENMAAFVEGNGLGIAVHSSEIGDIAGKIAAFDYEASVSNIKRYNEEHGMGREIHRLVALYDEIT